MGKDQHTSIESMDMAHANDDCECRSRWRKEPHWNNACIKETSVPLSISSSTITRSKTVEEVYQNSKNKFSYSPIPRNSLTLQNPLSHHSIMQLINVLQAAVLFISYASASPIPEPDALTPNAATELLKRANPAPVSCGRKLEISLQMMNLRPQY